MVKPIQAVVLSSKPLYYVKRPPPSEEPDEKERSEMSPQNHAAYWSLLFKPPSHRYNLENKPGPVNTPILNHTYRPSHHIPIGIVLDDVA